MTIRSCPYGRYVTNANGDERASLFIRLEHLYEDLAPLETHLGFKLREIPHENRSDRTADWRGYYSASDAELIAKACAADIDRFSYSFDQYAPRHQPFPGLRNDSG
ncbi:MAG: hypothetical protein LBE86_02990 [Gemmobacter sp.]|jgi:hypothetical protein|nr:hypothetical protein [Gemmobacter sp.]